jgi:nicotinamide mononucleotide transporter
MHEIIRGLLDGIRQTTPLEWTAAITGFVNVYLLIRNSIWNWPWGIACVALYGFVFLNQRLYANAWLQFLYYLPISAFGWYVWLRYGPKKQDDLPITFLPNRERFGYGAVCVALTVPIVLYLKSTKDPLPWIDGVTTAVSIVAQYLQVHKRFENWILWLLVDLIYVFYLFPVQKLYVSTGLYVFFTLMAIWGMAEWWRLYRGQTAATPVA